MSELKTEEGTPEDGEESYQIIIKKETPDTRQEVTQAECNLCVLRRAEVNRLLEENSVSAG